MDYIIRHYVNIILAFTVKQRAFIALGLLCLCLITGIIFISMPKTSGTRTQAQQGIQPTQAPAYTGNLQQIPTESVHPISGIPVDASKKDGILSVVISFFNPNPTPSAQAGNVSTSTRTAGSLRSQSTNQQSNNNASNQSAGSGNTSSGGSQSGQGSGSQSGSAGSGNSGNSGTDVYPTLPPLTDVQIIFKDYNGVYQTYIPPAVPPINVNWLRYTNTQDHYAIDIPADWEIVKSNYNGHEGITLYRSGGDPNDIDRLSIAFVGWQSDYLNSSANYTGQIWLNGVPGTIYTNGPLGVGTIAVVFDRSSAYFAMGSRSSDPVFIYVFDHMLRSINFNN